MSSAAGALGFDCDDKRHAKIDEKCTRKLCKCISRERMGWKNGNKIEYSIFRKEYDNQITIVIWFARYLDVPNMNNEDI